mmetsp:Transcript_13286/g.24930  ORF Transcript_13286/g.24930 Transcript_13286/m.24930 type:complete len:1045 (-) Transcript_13286:14-3148(-)
MSEIISIDSSIQEEKKDDTNSNGDTTNDLHADPSLISQVKVSHESIEDEPRRSGRKRKSTTMIVDGHVVKTENNYVLKGDSYSFGAFQADASTPKRVKKTTPAKKSNGTSAHHKKHSLHMQNRLDHNAVVKDRMARDEQKRMDFMATHYDALEPFVDEKVKASLAEYLKSKKVGANGSSGKLQQEQDDSILGAQPDIVTTVLRDYQMIGLDWMVKMHSRGMPFILGDEMGLGKTLQTISLIAHLKEKNMISSGPSLVICPLSVLYSWCGEVQKHAPSLKYFRLHASDPKEKENQKHIMNKDILQYDIIITTYDMVKSTEIQSLIRNTYFNLCVLDEGHVIKNTDTHISEAVRKIHSQNKVILTGTPLQNNLVELYAILNYLYPQFFTKSHFFANAFDIGQNRIDPDMLLKANRLLSLFMIRRLKQEVEKLMPKKIETKILCPLSSSQIFWYKGFLMNEIEALIKMSEESDNGEATKGRMNMLRNLVMQLRKCCLHPYLFDFAEPDVSNTGVEELIASSGKLAVLDKLLRSLFKNGHRTCIFSQFTSMLNILEDYCVLRGWRYCRFDGSTPRAQRNHLINQFNAPGSDDFIFLMSTRSGGLGINLQTADTCILYDSDWNPQPDLQAMARVHRIGQKKTVHIYRLVSSGTVEERILERAEKKLYLDQMVNRGGSTQDMNQDGSGLSSSELLASLQFGSNAIFASANDLPTDSDIRTIIDRNRSETTSDGLLKGGVTNTANDFDKDKKLTDVRTFEGVDFRKLRDANISGDKKNKRGAYLKELKQEWKEAVDFNGSDMGKGKRNKKSRIINVNGIGSGYGSASVPILALNDYDLQQGEHSVWTETKRPVVQKSMQKVRPKQFMNQDFCQTCGQGGELILCPRCPVSVHSHCCGLRPDHFQSCSHHRCSICEKTANGAGGLIYPCQSCPSAFCGDCLPSKDIRFLGNNIPRFEKLGRKSNNLYHYIHCSKQCEHVATVEFGFKDLKIKPKCPPSIDVSYAFGKNALSIKEIANLYKEGDDSHPSPNKLRKSPRKGAKAIKSEDVIVLE